MKLKKKLLLSAEMMALLVVLTGCMQYDENKNPTGFIYDYLVVPTGNLIVMLAEMLNGNYRHHNHCPLGHHALEL